MSTIQESSASFDLGAIPRVSVAAGAATSLWTVIPLSMAFSALMDTGAKLELERGAVQLLTAKKTFVSIAITAVATAVLVAVVSFAVLKAIEFLEPSIEKTLKKKYIIETDDKNLACMALSGIGVVVGAVVGVVPIAFLEICRSFSRQVSAQLIQGAAIGSYAPWLSRRFLVGSVGMAAMTAGLVASAVFIMSFSLLEDKNSEPKKKPAPPPRSRDSGPPSSSYSRFN